MDVVVVLRDGVCRVPRVVFVVMFELLLRVLVLVAGRVFMPLFVPRDVVVVAEREGPTRPLPALLLVILPL